MTFTLIYQLCFFCHCLLQGSKLKAATNNSGAHTVRRENNLGSPRECPGLDESYKLSGSLPNYLDAERPDVVLTGHRRFKYEHTWGHDQGYASERSPEDDHMPAFLNTAESPTPALWKARLDHLVRNYPFITPGKESSANMFSVFLYYFTI